MSDNIPIRCSSLPLIMQCAAAAESVNPVIDSGNDAAAVGSAVHHFLTERILGHEIEPADAAALFAADFDEVGMLCAMGLKCWRQVAQWFAGPEVEVDLKDLDDAGIDLTGHVDVLSVHPDEVRIVDFKTGRLDADYDDQLRGYAYLALIRHQAIDIARVCVIRVREQTIDVKVYSRDELDNWFTSLARHVQNRHKFTPGRHCGYCPRSATCPAKTAMLKQSVEWLMDTLVGPELPADPIEANRIIGHIYDRARIIISAAEQAKELVRACVETAGGVIDLGDGRELVLREQQTKRIDYATGKAILHQEIGDDLDQAIKVAKGKVEEIVKAGAGRGQKGKAVAALMDRLDQAGALITETTTRLECRRRLETERNVEATEYSAIERV